MPTALITGASAGLGAEFARQLADAGHDLVLVARDAARLEVVAADARARGAEAEVLPADLATADGRAVVAERVSSLDAPLDLLVNNAGYGLAGSILRTEAAHEREALDVMVTAVLELSHAAVGAMTARGSGAIVNVASVAAWLGNGSYAAHKAWVVSFTEGLAVQLRGTGVRVTAVMPGLTRTEFHARAGLEALASTPDVLWLDAPRVVRSALAASARGRVLVTPSARYAMVVATVRAMPRWLVRRIGARSGARRAD